MSDAPAPWASGSVATLQSSARWFSSGVGLSRWWLMHDVGGVVVVVAVVVECAYSCGRGRVKM